MNPHDSSSDSHSPGVPDLEIQQTALFAHLLMQQTNMALLLLGKMKHPETGETTKDLESARIFIDTLEMLEAKTKGNLSSEENRLLKQALMSVRMSYVEAVESEGQTTAPSPSEPAAAQTASSEEKTPEPSDTGEEQRKKFSKKY